MTIPAQEPHPVAAGGPIDGAPAGPGAAVTAPGPAPRRLDGRPVTGGAYDIDLSDMPIPGQGSSLAAAANPHMLGVRDVGAVFMPGDGTPAGVGRRVAAYLIDLVVQAGSAFLVGLGVLNVAGAGGSLALGSSLALLLTYVFVAVLAPIALMWVWGRTPGKKLLRIKVIDARLGTAPKWRAPLRWLVAGGYTVVLPAVMVIPSDTFTALRVANAMVLLMSLGFLLVDPQERALWDRAAGTVVVAE